ncbi:unnamed protein product [Pleuronectes platessa]|uniref:AMOP domain-containing protein n=1 Tax=Pleuronectes platessa TaxID=8262 RepID=A0A9N7W332_PLEPL|nr:unnamed protein product [Pleuronectes platessa]
MQGELWTRAGRVLLSPSLCVSAELLCRLQPVMFPGDASLQLHAGWTSSQDPGPRPSSWWPSSLQAELSYLFSLGRKLVSSGAFSFLPVAPRDQSECQLGNIRITASSTSDGAKDEPGLWSRAHVLTWNFEQTFRDDSAAWAEDRCLQWDVVEEEQPESSVSSSTDPALWPRPERTQAGLILTPAVTLRRAVCTYYPGSVHCVRAIQASPTHGSGQQCCYDSSGALMLTGDSFCGSSPDRAHDWGSPPYREPPRVPGYSHWLYDVMSFQYCCLWSDHCHIYFTHRPPSGCRSPRKLASSSGIHIS